MQSLAELQRTEKSVFTCPRRVPPGLTTRSRDHFLPFQCRTWLMRFSVGPSVPLPKSPTAQQSADVTQVESSSSLILPLPLPPGSGVRTAVHFLPFQCSASLSRAPPPERSPTAQQFAAATHRTANNSLTLSAPVPPGLGTETFRHLVPFQRST